MSRVEAFLVEAGATLVKRSGENLIARCPFHDDHKRSFSMNETTGQFICFAASCGEQGGLFSFLLKACGYSPQHAKKYAEEFGQDLDRPTAGEWAELPEWRLRRHDMSNKLINERLLAIYDFCPEYMLKRGFSKHGLRAWEIGYDFEMRRVTVPVRDQSCNLVGITKRATLPTQETKYLHLEFSKSQFLYGEHRFAYARADAVWAGEGQFDALALSELGVNYPTSTMGARVSKTQLKMLARYPSVVLAYDDDADGLMARERVGDYLLERGREVWVARRFPEREHPEMAKWDPADLLRYGTVKEVERFINDLEPWDAVRLESYTRAFRTPT